MKVRVNGTWFVHWHFASQTEPPSVLRGDLDWTTSGWLDRDPNSGLAFQSRERRQYLLTYQMGRARGRGSGE